MRGTPGKRSCNTVSARYSGRKSWPHCETQCASSMANRARSGSSCCRRSSRFRKSVRQQPFRRDIQQLQLAAHQLPRHLARLFGIQAGIEESGRHAELLERIHLVLHQRDQRRHHDADALPQQGRNLVAQRLAAAGGHQHQRIAARRRHARQWPAARRERRCSRRCRAGFVGRCWNS